MEFYRESNSIKLKNDISPSVDAITKKRMLPPSMNDIEMKAENMETNMVT